MNEEEILQTLRREASERLLAGVASEEAPALLAAYEQVMRFHMAKEYNASDPGSAEVILFGGRFEIEEACKLPPEARREHFQQEALGDEIHEFDDEARRLAEESLQSTADLPALRLRMRLVEEQLRQVDLRLQAMGPGWEERFARWLSETRLDCAFVLGRTPYSSLRLGRRIRFMQEVGVWPPGWYEELWGGRIRNRG